MAEHTDLERDLRLLETTLRRLETEYTMFFAGHLPKPPLETRAKVEALLRRYDRAYIQSYADRFRLNTLQGRFSAFTQLWDRGLRAREEGRPGPYTKGPREGAPPTVPPPPEEDEAFTGGPPSGPVTAAPASASVAAGSSGPVAPPPSGPVPVPARQAPPVAAAPHSVKVTVADAGQEAEKLQALYRALVEARRQTGNQETLPFQRFAQMVSTQVSKLRDAGSREVAFHVAVKDGKVSLTAKGIKGGGGTEGGGREEP